MSISGLFKVTYGFLLLLPSIWWSQTEGGLTIYDKVLNTQSLCKLVSTKMKGKRDSLVYRRKEAKELFPHTDVKIKATERRRNLPITEPKSNPSRTKDP